jgi:hypothetical protein
MSIIGVEEKRDREKQKKQRNEVITNKEAIK